MPKMHELLAVESDAIQVADKLLEEASTTFSKRPDHFRGQTKATTYLSADRQGENTATSKEIVTTVDDKLNHLAKGLVRLYDVLVQRDSTNQLAKADVTIGGKVLLKDVPGIFLLSMEQRLKALRGVLEAVPTLEPAVAWSEDKDKGDGIYRSPSVPSFKTEKVMQVLTLAAPTDKHPAQVEKYSSDVSVARVETVDFSGMWSVARKAEVLDRLDSLLYGIKQARMRANLQEVVPVNVGQTLLDFVLKG